MKYIALLIMLSGIIALSFKKDDGLNEALKQAGSNKPELEKVINHYKKSSKDALKLKAAYFLITNMPGHYGLYPNEDGYPGLEMIEDVKKISAEQLIENIDCAFTAWKYPWSKHLTFEEFCEHILPYRFNDEIIESWRPEFMKRYAWLTDSMKTSTDPVKACELVNNEIKKWFVFNNTNIQSTKSPLTILKQKNGRCTEQAAIASYTMRAMGIPVAHEYIPNWGNRHLGHDFSAVLSKTGEFVAFLGGELPPGKNEIRDIAPKIYRRGYLNPLKIDPATNRVLSFGKDVTSDYLNVTNVKLSTSGISKDLLQSVYLCVFSKTEWVPVCLGKVINDELCFDHVGGNIVYLAMSYADDEATAIQEPFLLQGNGAITTLKPTAGKSNQSIKITRKYPIPRWWNQRINSIKGGVFQAANNKEFKEAVNIHSIDYPSKMIYQHIDVNQDKGYRFWRLLYPDSGIVFTGIAELEFYDQRNEKLNGTPFSVSEEVVRARMAKINKKLSDSLIAIGANSMLKYANSNISRSFDNDALSYFSVNSFVNFIGVDFGKAVKVKEIKFLSENDDNGINEGQVYELFYWEDQDWKSLGEQIGTSKHELIYKNIPANALFLVRNLTKGIEQRIFTYNNQQQTWW